MRFALIDNKQEEAKTGLKGVCPGCFQPVIAKCGNLRVHHWAHVGNKMCDSWWEAETEWHRNWKNNFPKKWQEVFLPDKKTGEKHVADLRTSHGLIVEFQHSSISSEERHSRERFYKNMVWVVDGTRLKRDYSRFLKGKVDSRFIRKGIFGIPFPEEYIPTTWVGGRVPVIFDFRGNENITDIKDERNFLYCLFPVRLRGEAIIAEIPKDAFIKTVISGEWSERTKHFVEELVQVRQEIQDQLEKRQQQQRTMIFQNRIMSNGYGRFRRF